jgi:peptidoglycan/LPS O-acetylase OafA/YrhL
MSDAAPSAPAPALRHGTRPDIQGLRALAVVAVVLDHTVGFPGGGFVGVDMFFVLSGFLITGLLLREYEATGRISLAAFYRRRALRILPAALLVILVTLGIAALVFNSSRFDRTVVDGLWSSLFVANWHFLDVGTDYFAAAGPVSPLQHYWSLAVEEQFYLVWPGLILVTLLIARRAGARRQRRIPGGLILALTAASFAWALWESRSAPTQAYFSTVSRGWELGVGALLAVHADRWRGIPPATRSVLGWSGLAVIVVALVVVRGDTGFPAPAALLPVLGTALVILAGTGAVSAASAGPGADDRGYSLPPLTNPVSGYLGDISYSLYLWHWPVLVLLASVVPAGTRFYFSVVLIITLGLSVAGFHLVEDPLRRSRLARRRADALLHDPVRPVPRGGPSIVAGIGAALLATATISSIVAVVALL